MILSDILTFELDQLPVTNGQLELMFQVSKLVRLLLVIPATNATSERSFSAV